jgi:hypothetical protein
MTKNRQNGLGLIQDFRIGNFDVPLRKSGWKRSLAANFVPCFAKIGLVADWSDPSDRLDVLPLRHSTSRLICMSGDGRAKLTSAVGLASRSAVARTPLIRSLALEISIAGR